MNFPLKIALPYQCRWVRKADEGELINLYHLARTALAGNKDTGRHARMVWAAGAFAKEHRYVTSTGAYKDLDGLLG